MNAVIVQTGDRPFVTLRLDCPMAAHLVRVAEIVEQMLLCERSLFPNLKAGDAFLRQVEQGADRLRLLARVPEGLQAVDRRAIEDAFAACCWAAYSPTLVPSDKSSIAASFDVIANIYHCDIKLGKLPPWNALVVNPESEHGRRAYGRLNASQQRPRRFGIKMADALDLLNHLNAGTPLPRAKFLVRELTEITKCYREAVLTLAGI